jgi:hypothetical protein
MANVLNTDKQIMIVGALAEGSSICSTERMTGVYVWLIDTGDPEKPHPVTVLHSGPTASAAHTVRAAIIQEFRSLEPAQEI